MKPFLTLMLLMGWLAISGSLQAQSYDTPPFNFDRSTDGVYVDSLLHATRVRLAGLDRLRPTPTVDTARMEYLHFLGYVHYSGRANRDSVLVVANHLLRLAVRKKNVKFQIKALLQIERYYREVASNYPQAIQVNYDLLSLVETGPDKFDLYFWRIYRNLGHISNMIGEYGEAVTYLQKSIAWFGRDKKIDPIHLSDLHRSLASAYKGQQQINKAEAHFLLAWNLLNQQPSVPVSNKAFLTNAIGQVYNSQQKFTQAIQYLTQSVAYWGQLNAPLPQADALADLSLAYLGLCRYSEAIAAAQDALVKNQKVYAPRLTAYSVLVSAYEQQQDWKSAFMYQRLYEATKSEAQQAINQTESLRTKAKFDRDRLETAYRQERLLQQQRYQNLAKQAEIDRLSSSFKTNELRRLAQTNALKNQLERQQLTAGAAQKQALQQATIKQLKIDQQATERILLLVGIVLSSVVGLLLLYYSFKLRRTNVALRAKNSEIQLALIKGQTLERKRVATELHDRVSSLLGATKMTFQTIDSAVLPPRDKKLYENSLDLLTDAATQVRELSHNLIPDQLLQQDLSVSLMGLVKKLNQVGKTEFMLNGESFDKRPLTQEVKFNLYVICLELCTNILRHANAQMAHIELVWQDTSVVIHVSDDGVGLNDTLQDGFGLANIRERAETIGAQFRMESDQRGGTKASILLP
ncbi:tetratricopeptide repeat-containing sensor histidine kinase [Spirosoma endbachense]|nr:tetratricopeptide repeat-containing sensor histidine kinase [Spirosoma endbachense]